MHEGDDDEDDENDENAAIISAIEKPGSSSVSNCIQSRSLVTATLQHTVFVCCECLTSSVQCTLQHTHFHCNIAHFNLQTQILSIEQYLSCGAISLQIKSLVVTTTERYVLLPVCTLYNVQLSFELDLSLSMSISPPLEPWAHWNLY